MANPLTLSEQTTVTIEAATIEEALGRVTSELGSGARILRADRVRRGGIAGFFAREMIEIEVDAPEGKGVNGAFDRLLAAADGSDALSDRPTTDPKPTRPTLSSPPPAAIAGGGGPISTVTWESARMLELGLPGVLVQAVASLDPGDDLGHLTALTEALAPVCGPIADVPMRLVGARADRLRGAIDLEESSTGPIHLVVGDELPTALPGVPAMVSWVSDRGSVRAISMALGTGALLVYGIGSGFGAPARRISALDAAIAIRDMMDRT